ncbi:aspartate--tRNA(Asn) ligase [Candidatus Dojkabacteria bacterium]|jgi:aspartyl-tRNA synthetase|nr:aspartate--tRNA(Asn) ligase [Candidatus Dojkabacteria bacterium]
MKRTYIKELKESIGKEVLLKCWIQTIRSQGSMVFLIVRDVTGLIQCVALDKSVAKSLDQVKIESVIELTGLVKEEKQAPEGYEVEIKSFKVLSEPIKPLPIPIVEKTDGKTLLSKRLDYRWLDLRKPENLLVFKVWTTMENAFRQYCIEGGYTEIHSPKTLVTSTESGSELFEVKYFGRKAFLAQSPQLYKQMAMASGFEKVFEVGPVFRANPSFTSRHDTEFTMYDVELSFVESVEELLQEEEKMIVRMLKDIAEKYSTEIRSQYQQDIVTPILPFPRLSFSQAKEILKSRGIDGEKQDDLSPEDEREIGKYIKEKYSHDFVFIYDYPASSRAFYSMRYVDRPEYTKSFDLLYKGLEITSGAIREHRYEVLKSQIVKKGFKPEDFSSYLAFFEYGCPPHGGFAPGPTRILMQMLGVKNVREVTYIYRGVKRLNP